MTKINYEVRLPEIGELQQVLDTLTADGWSMVKISEPIKGTRQGIFVMVVFVKYTQVFDDTH